MDRDRVFVPLEAHLVALNRRTGATVWTRDLVSRWPPVVRDGIVYVAADDYLHAIDGATGYTRWQSPLAQGALAPLVASETHVVALVRTGEVHAFDADGALAWRYGVGAVKGSVALATGPAGLYLSFSEGRLLALSLRDGQPLWEHRVSPTLGPPAIVRDRVIVGSTENVVYAIDAETGRLVWRWRTGGDVVGAVGDDDAVYVVGLDNVLRAVNRGNGNQRWLRDTGTRAILPPLLASGAVIVASVSPSIAAFSTKTGAPIATYSLPGQTSELFGAPLFDTQLRAFQVAAVAVTRDGRVVGLRPTAMTFSDPPLGPVVELPGRRLERERLPTRR